MADKVRDTHQFLYQKAKYIGLGDADTTREQFITNVQRDTLASVAMHDSLLTYNAVATNTHRELLRQQTIKKMVQPMRKTENGL
ncbi:CIC11C00000004407 [Sungouiella intermedia]|uniref:CIC11C00000004407 n=1 Tax=Sungouiella intermedia TaxID=45354 RepID=A0A1L0BAB1_9ASCO|nr:CIC11C00000004407 [[Candida] intermedia]